MIGAGNTVIDDINYVCTFYIICNDQQKKVHIFTKMMSRICAKNCVKNKTSEYVQ